MKCWAYHFGEGNPEKLMVCIEDFLNTFIDVAKDLDFDGHPIYESMVKLKAYNYRKLFRYEDALKIFIAGMKNNPDNYHWVEDCLETYLKMNQGVKAIQLLNVQPIQLIASEKPESADRILAMLDENPILNQYINTDILIWAKDNSSKTQ